MVYGRNLIGGLGFARTQTEKGWEDESIALLKIIGETFANALHRQKVEREFMKISQEKFWQARRIAGGFAHEIRNALFPARGSLSLLKKAISEQYADDPNLSYFQKTADDAITRAIDITALISHYTKLDSEKLPGSVNLSAVLKELIMANQLRISEQKVSIKVECPPNMFVESNQRQLFMALNNLFLNSLDAIIYNPTPLVSIYAARENGYMNLQFVDNGIGIPEDSRDRIFEAFFSTKPDRGTGLGLAVTKKIIEMYGGGISVSSKPNEGARFDILLRLSNINSGRQNG